MQVLWYVFVCFVVPPTEEIKLSLAARLKNLRLKNGVSLQAAADAIGISKAHLWELEMGKSTNPSVDLLVKLANYFKVSIASLVGENPKGEEDEKLVAMFRQLKQLDPSDRELIQLIMDQQKKKGKKGDDPD